MAEHMVVVPARVPPRIATAIAEEARAQDRTNSAVIRRALEAYFRGTSR